MTKFAWLILVMVLSSNTAPAATCSNSQDNKVSSELLLQQKSNRQLTDPSAAYSRDSQGSTFGDILLDMSLYFLGQGQNILNNKLMYVIVSNKEHEWNSDFSIKMVNNEMLCLLQSGDAVLTSFPLNDHISTIWSLNHAKGTALLIEEIPFDSPFLEKNNAGRYRGRITKDKKSNAVLVEVPIDDLKVGLLAALLKFTKNRNVRDILASGISKKEVRYRQSILYANAALQCALQCLSPEVRPSGETDNTNLTLIAVDSFSSFALLTQTAISNNRNSRDSLLISDKIISLWPENHAIILARLAISSKNYDAARRILAVLERHTVRNKALIALMQAIVTSKNGEPIDVQASAKALKLSGDRVKEFCTKSIRLDGRNGAISLRFYHENAADSDECWRDIAVLRDALVLNYGLAALARDSQRALDSMDDWSLSIVRSSPAAMISLILAYSDSGQHKKAISLVVALQRKLTRDEMESVKAVSQYTIIDPELFVLKYSDPKTSLSLYTYLLQKALLMDRVIWKCSGSSENFIQWVADAEMTPSPVGACLNYLNRRASR